MTRCPAAHVYGVEQAGKVIRANFAGVDGEPRSANPGRDLFQEGERQQCDIDRYVLPVLATPENWQSAWPFKGKEIVINSQPDPSVQGKIPDIFLKRSLHRMMEALQLRTDEYYVDKGQRGVLLRLSEAAFERAIPILQSWVRQRESLPAVETGASR